MMFFIAKANITYKALSVHFLSANSKSQNLLSYETTFIKVCGQWISMPVSAWMDILIPEYIFKPFTSCLTILALFFHFFTIAPIYFLLKLFVLYSLECYDFYLKLFYYSFNRFTYPLFITIFSNPKCPYFLLNLKKAKRILLLVGFLLLLL